MDTIERGINMDTIDGDVMERAAEQVWSVLHQRELLYVHTVIVTLNGEHGGADVIIEGFPSNDVSAYNKQILRKVVR